ncbi:MAG: CDP-alcohol phosphatidyltransferase family protein [Coriobacteriales bacterium]|nr:CDP-alcohol phosphatidyltransferase family protein [Coriobacteriales bacterium]
MKVNKQQVTNAIFTPANFVSGLRLLLLPVFCVLLVGYQNNLWAFIVLMIAALTDLIDGQLARFTNTVSKLGIQLDPVVDRIFIFIAVLTIFAVGRLPLWLLVSFVLRDAILLGLSIYLKRMFNRVINVVILGKMTTALAMSGFCSLVMLWPVIPGLGLIDSSLLPGLGAGSAALGYVLLYFGTVFSWISAIIYIVQGLKPEATLTASQEASGNSKTPAIHSEDLIKPIKGI